MFSDVYDSFGKLVETQSPINACGIYATAMALDTQIEIFWPTLKSSDQQWKYMSYVYNKGLTNFKLSILWANTEPPYLPKFKENLFKSNHFSVLCNDQYQIHRTTGLISNYKSGVSEAGKEPTQATNIHSPATVNLHHKTVHSPEKRILSSKVGSPSTASTPKDTASKGKMTTIPPTFESLIKTVHSPDKKILSSKASFASTGSTPKDITSKVTVTTPPKILGSLTKTKHSPEVTNLLSKDDNASTGTTPKDTPTKAKSPTVSSIRLSSMEPKMDKSPVSTKTSSHTVVHSPNIVAIPRETADDESNGEADIQETPMKKKVTRQKRFRHWAKVYKFALDAPENEVLLNMKDNVGTNKDGQYFVMDNRNNRRRHFVDKNRMQWVDMDGIWTNSKPIYETYSRKSKTSPYHPATNITYDYDTRSIIYKKEGLPVPLDIASDLLLMYRYYSEHCLDKGYKRKITAFLNACPEEVRLLDRAVFEYSGKFPGFKNHGNYKVRK